MHIENSTVLITGANHVIGLAFAKAFLKRGARKVYAGSCDPSKITLPGVTPIKLEVNANADVQASAQLAKHGTQVLTLHMGFVDTDLTKGIEIPKETPEAIVDRALNALEAGVHEVVADDMTKQFKAGLPAKQSVYLAAR